MKNETPQRETTRGDRAGRKKGGGELARMDSWTNGALLLHPRGLVACEAYVVEILRSAVARKNNEASRKKDGGMVERNDRSSGDSEVGGTVRAATRARQFSRLTAEIEYEIFKRTPGIDTARRSMRNRR